MKKGDLSFCTYRGHAHTLARGVPVEKVLGELMQRDKRADARQGRLDAPDLRGARRDGSYAIIGAHLPIACGAAWRAQYKGDKGRDHLVSSATAPPTSAPSTRR